MILSYSNIHDSTATWKELSQALFISFKRKISNETSCWVSCVGWLLSWSLVSLFSWFCLFNFQIEVHKSVTVALEGCVQRGFIVKSDKSESLTGTITVFKNVDAIDRSTFWKVSLNVLLSGFIGEAFHNNFMIEFISLSGLNYWRRGLLNWFCLWDNWLYSLYCWFLNNFLLRLFFFWFFLFFFFLLDFHTFFLSCFGGHCNGCRLFDCNGCWFGSLFHWLDRLTAFLFLIWVFFLDLFWSWFGWLRFLLNDWFGCDFLGWDWCFLFLLNLRWAFLIRVIWNFRLYFLCCLFNRLLLNWLLRRSGVFRLFFWLLFLLDWLFQGRLGLFGCGCHLLLCGNWLSLGLNHWHWGVALFTAFLNCLFSYDLGLCLLLLLDLLIFRILHNNNWGVWRFRFRVLNHWLLWWLFSFELLLRGRNGWICFC